MTAEQAAKAAASGALVQNNLIYVPLTASAGALGWKVLQVYPLSATLQSGTTVAAVPLAVLGGQPFVSLGALSALPGTTTRLLPGGAGVQLTRNQQNTTLPIKVAQLIPFTAPPEFAAPLNP